MLLQMALFYPQSILYIISNMLGTLQEESHFKSLRQVLLLD